MKIKQRFLSLLLCGAMILSLCPQRALAIDIGTGIPGLGIGSTALKEDTYYLIGESGAPGTEGAGKDNYNFYYDTATSTLTLNNALLKNALFVPVGTTIELIGDNKFGEEGKTVSVGIQTTSETTETAAETALTIQGQGSLEIWCLNEGLVDVHSDSDKGIVIQGGTIEITNTQSSPIYSENGGITICGDANVTVQSGNSGISGKKDLTISENANVTVGGRAISGLSSSEKIVISDSAVVKATASNIAISGSKGVEILGKADVTAVGTTALNSFLGSIKIEGAVKATSTQEGTAAVSVGQGEDSKGSVTVTGSLDATGFVGIGVTGTGDIVIDGGRVTADATLVGLYPTGGGDVEIKNDAVVSSKVKNGYGIYSKSGAIDISNSTVEASTADGNYSALGNVPVLAYDNTYRVYAGDSVESAERIERGNLTDDVYKSDYIKIEPAYSVTLNTNDGLIAPGKDVTDYIYGKGVVLPGEEDITREGYTFVGWYEESDFSGSAVENITDAEMGNKIFYAKWSRNLTPIGPGVVVRYIVEHYKADADNESGYALAETEYLTGKIGEEVAAQPKEYEGYCYNEERSVAGGILTAIQSEADILTLRLYYDALDDTVHYIVEHYKADADSESGYTLAETEYLTGKIGEEVSVQPKEYEGYCYNEELSVASSILTATQSEEDILTLRLYYDKILQPELPNSPGAGLSDEAAVLLGMGIVAAGSAAVMTYQNRAMLPIWKVEGIAKLTDGTPAANVTVTLMQNGEVVKALTTDADGIFATRVPKGDYDAIIVWQREEVRYTARGKVVAESILRDGTRQEILLEKEE